MMFSTLDVLYYVMLGFLFTHEMDAVKRHEWRIMPLIRYLPEKSGEQLFIWLHIPIFIALLLLGDGNEANMVRIGLAVFAVAHMGLHWLFRNHPANEFNNVSSWGLILGTGMLGASYTIAVTMR